MAGSNTLEDALRVIAGLTACSECKGTGEGNCSCQTSYMPDTHCAFCGGLQFEERVEFFHQLVKQRRNPPGQSKQEYEEAKLYGTQL